MVAAFSLRVSFGLPPRNGQRCHNRALESFVLMGQQQLIAGVEQVAAITRLTFEVLVRFMRALPLLDETAALRFEWLSEALEQSRDGSLLRVAERDSYNEFLGNG